MPRVLSEHVIVPLVETSTLSIIATVIYESLDINASIRDGKMATNISSTECKSEIIYTIREENFAGLIFILELAGFEYFWRLRKF